MAIRRPSECVSLCFLSTVGEQSFVFERADSYTIEVLSYMAVGCLALRGYPLQGSRNMTEERAEGRAEEREGADRCGVLISEHGLALTPSSLEQLYCSRTWTRLILSTSCQEHRRGSESPKHPKGLYIANGCREKQTSSSVV